jgi:hypothetical protein
MVRASCSVIAVCAEADKPASNQVLSNTVKAVRIIGISLVLVSPFHPHLNTIEPIRRAVLPAKTIDAHDPTLLSISRYHAP